MKKLSGFLGLAMLAGSAQLGAAIQISYQIGGTNPSQTICALNAGATDDSGVCANAVGTGADSGVSILEISASSNSPGTASLAQQFGATLQIINSTASTVAVDIWISAPNFSLPVTGGSISGINYEGSLSTTSTTGAGSVSSENCVDQSNGLTEPFCATAAATIADDAMAYSGGSSASETNQEIFSPLSSMYSLSQMITISLGAGSNINVITSQSLTPVPEPASIALLGGAILLTSGAIRRKRKQQGSRV